MQAAKKLSSIEVDPNLLQTAYNLGLNPQKVCENALNEMIKHLARGVGFEPTRPFRTTDLAGLPPTRLGQPRPVFNQPRRFLRGFSLLFACFSFASFRIVVGPVYLRFRKNSRSSFSQMYSNPTEMSFFISSLSFVAVTSYSSSLLSPNMACSTWM